MTTKKHSKLKHLLQIWPEGTVAVQKWLSNQTISNDLKSWYLKSGWLERIGTGAYIRTGDKVSWVGGLFAIQQYLNLHIHVAAKTALELRGQTQYLNLGANEKIILFGESAAKLPGWFSNNSVWKIHLDYFTPKLFSHIELGINMLEVNNINIKISSKERAIMEVLYLVPNHQTLEEAYSLMEGLTTLRPALVQQLLENCSSIRVKRLFMLFAENCNHSWYKHIKLNKIDFGKGKLVVAGGGNYHAKYRLSLPNIEKD